mmetsp:Transcript_97433/g.183216  ORF Transcript_97433/g.183216 Transcript_97433/m.183216 type:complete len:110 (-) Transcript_97433:252-581(-)
MLAKLEWQTDALFKKVAKCIPDAKHTWREAAECIQGGSLHTVPGSAGVPRRLLLQEKIAKDLNRSVQLQEERGEVLQQRIQVQLFQLVNSVDHHPMSCESAAQKMKKKV